VPLLTKGRGLKAAQIAMRERSKTLPSADKFTDLYVFLPNRRCNKKHFSTGSKFLRWSSPI
jgi:hypothetical protein